MALVSIHSSGWIVPGYVFAHLVTSTHMGTINDRVLGFRADGTVHNIDDFILNPGSGPARVNPPCPFSAR